MKPRIGIIEEEFRRLVAEHPWAGSYDNGCGFDGDILTLALDASFKWKYFDCIQVNDVGVGTVVERDGEIELLFSTGASHPRVAASGSRFLVVSWGEDRFLVPRDRMPDFANDFNDGSLHRTSTCGRFMRHPDAPHTRTGKPSVSSEYAALFLDLPLEAHIVALAGYRDLCDEDWWYKAALVRLDVGTSHGAFLGMVLRVQAPALHNAYRIVELDATSSIAQRSRFTQTEPEVGWRLCTDY